MNPRDFEAMVLSRQEEYERAHAEGKILQSYYKGIGLTPKRAADLAACYVWGRYQRHQDRVIEEVLKGGSHAG